MSKYLTVIFNSEPYISSLLLAKKLEFEHRYVRKILKKYKEEFLECGQLLGDLGDENLLENDIELRETVSLNSRSKKPKEGRKFKEIFLNEYHMTFLFTLVENSKKALQIKLKLSKDFVDQKRELNRIKLQKQNEEWLANREHGKIARRDETDAIKEFVKLAEIQGSKNARKYYMIITKMQYDCMFCKDLKDWNGGNWKGIRDKINISSLNSCMVSDKIAEIAVKKAVLEKLDYHEAYQYLKRFSEHFFMNVPKIGKEEATGQKDCNFNKTLLI